MIAPPLAFQTWIRLHEFASVDQTRAAIPTDIVLADEGKVDLHVSITNHLYVSHADLIVATFMLIPGEHCSQAHEAVAALVLGHKLADTGITVIGKFELAPNGRWQMAKCRITFSVDWGVVRNSEGQYVSLSSMMSVFHLLTNHPCHQGWKNVAPREEIHLPSWGPTALHAVTWHEVEGTALELINLGLQLGEQTCVLKLEPKCWYAS